MSNELSSTCMHSAAEVFSTYEDEEAWLARFSDRV